MASSSMQDRPRRLPNEKEDYLSSVFVQTAHILAQVITGHSLSQVFEKHWRDYGTDLQSAVSHLCYHVLREFGSLEAIIDQLAKKPPEKPQLLALLLAACYRLKTRPLLAYATIDQAVQAAKVLHLPTGFVNAILRNYLRNKADIDQYIEASEAPEIRYNFPAWWLFCLQNQYPDDWEHIVTMSNSHPPMTLRVNQKKISVDAYLDLLQKSDINAIAIDGQAIRLIEPVSVSDLPGFFEALVSVQDASAQKAAEFLSVKSGDHVLDACCAPGGKTGHMLEMADISLLGLDVDASRIDKVRENLDRLDLMDESKVSLVVSDCRKTDQWFDGQPFDKILLDAPCSGSGVVRRHPDGKWLKSPKDVVKLQQTQQGMLHSLWQVLKPGGLLLYATCSVFEAENQQQIKQFLSETEDARCCLISGNEMAQFLPTEDHDGFFYALLQKRKEEE